MRKIRSPRATEAAVLATSMIQIHGAGASKAAQQYAERLRSIGDQDVCDIWLLVLAMIERTGATEQAAS